MEKELQLGADHEAMRRKFWTDVYIAYTRSANSAFKDQGIKWADFALAEFDKRFPDMIIQSNMVSMKM